MLVGHKNQWNFLTKTAGLGQLPHALLFSGQEQLGKRTLAVEFAKFLNCLPALTTPKALQAGQSKSERPCHVCRNCQDIEKGIFPDFISIESQNVAGEIQISQIRELIKKLSLRPYASSFKIAVLNNAHLMTEEAQNCFLKFLEEPRGKTILILTTGYPDTLLPTIISRVHKIEEIKNYFLEQNISEKKAGELSSLSEGKPGRALNFYFNPEKLEEEKKLVTDLIKISRSELAFRFRYAKSFSDLSSGKLKNVLGVWLIYLRSIFISRVINQEKRDDFNNYSLLAIKEVIKNIQETIFLISSTNVNLKLAFENLLIKLP